jgi:hypothetical protein
MPGKHPKENILHLTHSESLESRKLFVLTAKFPQQTGLYPIIYEGLTSIKLDTTLAFTVRPYSIPASWPENHRDGAAH